MGLAWETNLESFFMEKRFFFQRIMTTFVVEKYLNDRIMEQNQNQQPQPPVFNQAPQPAQPAGPQFQPRVTAKPMMNPVESVVTCIKKYFIFKGRARRSEFWWFALAIVLLNFLSSFLGFISPTVSLVISICVILLFIPNVAALTRRLHDANHSGWWVASFVICLVGYMASYAYLLGPNIDSFTNATDPMALAGELAESIKSSPIVATIMACCSFGVFILFIITFFFALQDSKWGENKYGPSPKYN